MIGVLDYGAGNFGSVCRALEALNVTYIRVANSHDFLNLTTLIFPGVGAAGATMSKLRAADFDVAIKKHVSQKRKLLGICVGMQVLGAHSEEDDVTCLDLMPFRVQKMSASLPIPHMGWNNLQWNAQHTDAAVFSRDCGIHPDVYFVHSYAALTNSTSTKISAASVEYGGSQYVAMVAHENVWGCQFHVEKSGVLGLQIIRNFLEAPC